MRGIVTKMRRLAAQMKTPTQVHMLHYSAHPVEGGRALQRDLPGTIRHARSIIAKLEKRHKL